MGVKKKEEKKQEDIIDISTLPPCKTLIASFTCHPYFSNLNKYLKVNDFKTITRDDLLNALKEKTIEPSPSSLALVCKSKIEELQIPIRKDKKDSPRKDEGKFDLILVLKNYPLTTEEAQELDLTENFIEIFLYLRPNKSKITVQFNKKIEGFNTKVQEIINSGGDPNTLVQPVLPELYPGSLLALHDFSLHKSSYKQVLIQVEEFDTEEDLEFKEEIKEEKEEVKKKDPKAPQKKGEEPKEEETDPNDPKIKFCSGSMEKLKSLINSRTEYEMWKITLNLVHLFPESKKNDLKASKSQASIASSAKKSDHGGASLDDLAKKWDFSYFHACVKKFPEDSAETTSVLCCIFRWICRDALDCQLFSPIPRPANPIKVIDFNNLSEKRTENQKYYLSSELLPDTLLKIFQNLAIPELLPTYTEKSIEKRVSETVALQYFSAYKKDYFERCLNILEFEKLLLKIHPERTWDLSQRKFEEKFTLVDFSQLFLDMKVYEPEILTEYISRTDSLLMVVLFRTPPGRIIRKAWKSPWKVCPSFSQYLNIYEKSETDQLYNIDPSLVGCIKERSKIMYPADNSVIKMIEYHIAGKNTEFSESHFSPKFRPVVFKDNWYFGMRNNGKNEFWAKFKNEMMLAELGEQGLELNFTLDSGLIVKIFPSGEILQQRPESEEESRMVFQNGAVAKYKKDGTIEILMPNGEVSKYTKDKLWVVTNNKGKRIAKRGKQVFSLDSIQVTSQIDAETLAKVVIREDLVLSLGFVDNSKGVFHEDGTRIYRSSDKNTIFVESPGYAPVHIYKDPIKARQNTVIGLGSSDSGLGAEDLMLRSNDGMLIETVLPNNTKVQSIVQKQELEAYNEFSVNRINLVTHSDGAIFKTTQEGEIVFISAQARDVLSSISGKDAYFFDIFTLPEERNSGVYTARVDQGKIFTKDNEGNYFEISTDGRAVEKLAVSLNVEDTEPESPVFEGEEYIDPECKFLPPPVTIISPRVFVIQNKEVREYLEYSQLDYHFRNFTGKYVKEQFEDFISHTWITSKKEQENFAFPDSPFEKHSLPKLVKPMLQTLILSDKPKDVSFVKRKISEFWEMDEEKRESVKKSLKDYEKMKNDRAEEKKKLEIVDPRSEAEVSKYNSFLARLGKSRGIVEVKAEKEEEEFYVEISEDEVVEEKENKGKTEKPATALKIESA